jgi:hypothetical protein
MSSKIMRNLKLINHNMEQPPKYMKNNKVIGIDIW